MSDDQQTELFYESLVRDHNVLEPSRRHVAADVDAVIDKLDPAYHDLDVERSDAYRLRAEWLLWPTPQLRHGVSSEAFALALSKARASLSLLARLELADLKDKLQLPN